MTGPAGILASAALFALYARGGAAWPLGFVALVPWLLVLDRVASLRGALLVSIAMSMAFVGGVFAWFAPAVAEYTGWPPAAAWALLVLLAPLLQPQFIAFALAWRLARGRAGMALQTVVAVAAWLAAEWLVPRVFGDTLGHGLHPSSSLRQFADVAGAHGLTLALLAVNMAVTVAIRRRTRGVRALVLPLAVALSIPALLGGYGAWRLALLERTATTGTPLRIALVQASIVDYERLRRGIGAYAVVRHVLDTHYALSEQARDRHRVDVLVWSETVYPTTFLKSRSADGAALDGELLAFVRRVGMPLVFGTYERDDAGEYNVAAFVDPVHGPLGAYRKTRLFPLTEYVPPSIDEPALRAALPWTGTWQPGDGARVFPLRTADGREVPVVPLICRDDLDPRLAIDGARLGAQAIVGLSNDAWFTRHPQGARLHTTVAAFRSIETRLPQVRATTNGMSAVIDRTGAIVARTGMGERTVLVADIRARGAARTPVMMLGPWLGPLATVVLAIVGLAAAIRVGRARLAPAVGRAEVAAGAQVEHRVHLLSPWRRWSIAVLRSVAHVSVLVLGVEALLGDDASRGMLRQLRQFAVFVLAPELAAFALSWLAGARARIDGADLVLETHRRRIAIPLRNLVRARAWQLPMPSAGVDLSLASRGRWPQGIALRDASGFVDALVRGGAASLDRTPLSSRRAELGRALSLPRRRLDHPLLKFVLFPLVPALPAFRLHQHIAYGGTFGEYYTFGAAAYLGALGLWWASWAVALVLVAGALRLLVEGGTAVALAWSPARTARARAALATLAHVAYYLGVPAWLFARLLVG